jgi:demethylspheroidene O-methyltransferase
MNLIDAWRRKRDALLTSQKFQRWAAGVPGVRWIARRRARAVFDLVAGFVYSQVLYACVQLGIFARLANQPLTVNELADAVGLNVEACERLVAGAVALRLLEWRSGHRIGLGALGAPLAGNDGLQNLVRHHALLYSDLADPVALLRGEVRATRMSQYWPYAATDTPCSANPEVTGAYSALMSSTQSLIADDVLHAYRFDQHHCLLDVGGGEGEFLAAVGRRNPALQLRLFDLPAVAELARHALASCGLADRTQVAGGDFFADSIPVGADIVTIVRVMHDHDDQRILKLLRNVAAALPVGGTVLVAEPMADTPGAEPVGDAYFGFYFLAMGRGQARSFAQIADLLSRAGFQNARHLPTRMPLQTSVVTAVKAG